MRARINGEMLFVSAVPAAAAACVQALEGTKARKATMFLNEKMVVKLSRRHRPDRRNSRAEFVLTVGTPNYAELEFIKRCKRAGEPFPVRKVRLRLYPEKRA